MIDCIAIFIFTLVFATIEAEDDAVRSQILNNIEAGLDSESRTHHSLLAED
ncbi:hypothetical protein [Pleurocapsa sp. PCC 7319]|uniref:hypothetical protein n=1 Tax=Pleurocapsa sp. PCC 7319 TaxID=118161 RepID=UPI00034BC123|nr:hypothetical protein [Pleurocapsa sp. PCC 7319]